jgi:hypothetical protein
MSMVTYQKNFDEHLMMLEKFHERTGMFNIDLQPGKHASQNILSVALITLLRHAVLIAMFSLQKCRARLVLYFTASGTTTDS